MMAIEIIRFVAILQRKEKHGQKSSMEKIRAKEEGLLPTCHPSQRLDTRVHISLTLL